jgi:hypothetical protein
MQNDWKFCGCDLVATSQLLRLLSRGSGFVKAFIVRHFIPDVGRLERLR